MTFNPSLSTALVAIRVKQTGKSTENCKKNNQIQKQPNGKHEKFRQVNVVMDCPNDRDTHQLGRARLKEDGESITHSRHTIDKTDQNNIMVKEGRSWIGQEVKH